MQAAILSVARDGEKIAVARNAHKSITAGLILSGAYPIYIEPPVDPDLEILHVVTAEQVSRTLKAHRDVRAVVIVSPTYYGVAGEIWEIARVCHSHDVPLIVDEAWGAHFPFHPGLPSSAISMGADFSICSIHKTLTGLGQASIMLLKGDRIDEERVMHMRDLLESTSISTAILGSLDIVRQIMTAHGFELLDRTLALSRWARERISAIDGLDILGEEVLQEPGASALDRTKIVIEVRKLGINGYAAAEWLRKPENYAGTRRGGSYHGAVNDC